MNSKAAIQAYDATMLTLQATAFVGLLRFIVSSLFNVGPVGLSLTRKDRDGYYLKGLQMGGEYIQVDWWLYYWHVASAWILIGLAVFLIFLLLIQKLLVDDEDSIECSPGVENIVRRSIVVNAVLFIAMLLLMFIAHAE